MAQKFYLSPNDNITDDDLSPTAVTTVLNLIPSFRLIEVGVKDMMSRNHHLKAFQLYFWERVMVRLREWRKDA